jgi:hypothetical protein
VLLASATFSVAALRSIWPDRIVVIALSPLLLHQVYAHSCSRAVPTRRRLRRFLIFGISIEGVPRPGHKLEAGGVGKSAV